MSGHVASVRVERAGAPGRFFGTCSCGWEGVPMAWRLDAKLEAIMHADYATLRETPATLTPSEVEPPEPTP